MLIAHPNPQTRRELGGALTHDGHTWYQERDSLRSVLQDIHLLDHRDIGIVITACDMSVESKRASPGEDGRAITEAARKARPGIKVVVLYEESKPDYGDAQISYNEGMKAVLAAVARL